MVPTAPQCQPATAYMQAEKAGETHTERGNFNRLINATVEFSLSKRYCMQPSNLHELMEIIQSTELFQNGVVCTCSFFSFFNSK